MKYNVSISGDNLEWLYSPDWEYHNYGICKRHLQMIIPYRQHWNNNESFPLILYIPGSAWLKQEMYNDIPKLVKLAEKGFAIAAMEYREATIAKFPAQVDDVINAVNFLSQKAAELHIDMTNFFLMGNSSGGHIAMMSMLLDANTLCKPLPSIRGVICECGSTDIGICAASPLPPWMSKRPTEILLGVDSIEDNQSTAMKASCDMYITEGVQLPPVLLLHSDCDPIVSVENSRKLYNKLVATGHDVTYYELQDSHAHCGSIYFSDPVLDIVTQFLKSNTDANI